MTSSRSNAVAKLVETEAQTGNGLVLGGAVRYATGGLSVEFRASGLLAHSAEDDEE